MISSAPSEKDTADATVEKRRWDVVDQFRTTSGLKSQENSAPVLGLPRTNNATATRASAKTTLAKSDRRSVDETEIHWLWIQLLRSVLKDGAAGTSGWCVGFVIAKGVRSAHSYSVKIIGDMRQNAAEQGVSDVEALKKGTKVKSKEFVEKDAEVDAKA